MAKKDNNDKIRDLYYRYRFNADLMTCNECGYSIIASRINDKPGHAYYCTNDNGSNPWNELRDVLNSMPKPAGND